MISAVYFEMHPAKEKMDGETHGWTSDKACIVNVLTVEFR